MQEQRLTLFDLEKQTDFKRTISQMIRGKRSFSLRIYRKNFTKLMKYQLKSLKIDSCSKYSKNINKIFCDDNKEASRKE
jgi:hypothetical protein